LVHLLECVSATKSKTQTKKVEPKAVFPEAVAFVYVIEFSRQLGSCFGFQLSPF